MEKEADDMTKKMNLTDCGKMNMRGMFEPSKTGVC